MAVLRALFVWGCVLIGAATASALNLVPNPGFNANVQCPDDIDVVTGQIHFATPWNRAGASPDYFHGCGLTGSVEVPGNAFGAQCPFGDNCDGSAALGGYAGIAVFFENSTDLREYLQVPLDQALQGGKKYRVRFHVSHADFTRVAVDRLGAHVSTGAIVPGNGVLPLVPQVESTQGSIQGDEANWTLIHGKFTAAGGEDNLVIGNFRDDASTTTAIIDPGDLFDFAYYYIDQVSVTDADSFGITDNIAIPPPPGGSGQIEVVNAPSSSSLFLYCSAGLGGVEINGHPFDLDGGFELLATGTADASGNATMTWIFDLASPCFSGPGPYYFEVRADDPTSGQTSDSNELILVEAVPALGPGGQMTLLLVLAAVGLWVRRSEALASESC